MVFRLNRRNSILSILIITIFVPGYFGFFYPYIEGTYGGFPKWLNILLILIWVLVLIVAIKSLRYTLEINESGIKQKTIGSWFYSWKEIKGWSFKEDLEDNTLYLELVDNKQKAILSSFLNESNFSSIKAALERRLGKPSKLN